jgi:hypothetical protein
LEHPWNVERIIASDGSIREMNRKQLKSRHPDAPWMWKQDWAHGRIRCQSAAQNVLAWIMAVSWNAFMWTLLVKLWADQEKRIFVKVILLFCAVGLVLLGWAMKSTYAWLRFGTSVFEPSSVPGVIGGHLEGWIHTRLRVPPKAPLQLSLVCTRMITTSGRRTGGRSRSVRSDVLWQADHLVSRDRISLGPQGMTIPVRIGIPYGLKSSDSEDSDDKVLWHLLVVGELPGIDLRIEFLVPVFVTADSNPALTHERVDEEADQEWRLARQPSIKRKGWTPPVVVRPTAEGGIEYIFRPDVPLKVAVQLSILAVGVCVGSGFLFLWLEEAGPFALIPGAVGLLLLLASAVVWTGKSRVVIEMDRVAVRKSLLGIPLMRRIPFSEIKKIRVRREDVEGVQAKDRGWKIEIARESKRPLDLGASFSERSEAIRLVEEMERFMR